MLLMLHLVAITCDHDIHLMATLEHGFLFAQGVGALGHVILSTRNQLEIREVLTPTLASTPHYSTFC